MVGNDGDGKGGHGADNADKLRVVGQKCGKS
jgi:hypothetical protein